MTDTHAHLYSEQFDEDREEMLARAIAAGVQAIFLPNVDKDTIEPMLALEAAHPEVCQAMMGLHPCSVSETYLEELAIVRQWLERRKFCAIGEIGIDLYWDKTHVAAQEAAFLKQIEWALEFDLPVIIHSRESMDQILGLLAPLRRERLRGIFHCFTGDRKQAEQVIELGFLLGIGGVLTFKNSGLDSVLEQIGLEYMVLETDAPYLAPAPHRGKRNESAYLLRVAEKLAEVKGVSLETVSQITNQNAGRLFGPEG
ncbi:MAG: TatD family hydrolase [Haliscomenobacter sp.]|nr:TatD family hydrolase [Haliscomenobacter sp.]MBK7475789.1 TatD family hydrolase [Haliscomenobacter sp.]